MAIEFSAASNAEFQKRRYKNELYLYFSRMATEVGKGLKLELLASTHPNASVLR